MLDIRQTHGCGCDRAEPSAVLMPVEAAVSRALEQVAPILEVESVAVADAVGRVAAGDVTATAAMPFFDNSAMDGFAVSTDDFSGVGPWFMVIVGTVPAGGAGGAPNRPGTAQRIYTGAPIPEGCDAVVMVEDSREQGAGVWIAQAPGPGAHIRRAGSDMSAGARLIGAGTRLSVRHVGLLAANGIARLNVVRRPRVGVLSTGDEVTDAARGQGQVFDANRPMLCALARLAGAKVTDLGILPDDATATATRLGDLRGAYDLVLSSGAVSMGGRDFLRPAFEAAGGTIAAWRVALKPGKPVMFGRLGGTAFTALPGNPFAVFVGFHLFVSAQIARLTGQTVRPFAELPARAGFEWTRNPGRAEVFPVRLLHRDEVGIPVLQRLGCSVSATLYPLAEADGLAFVPTGTDRVRPGTALAWQPFAREEIG